MLSGLRTQVVCYEMHMLRKNLLETPSHSTNVYQAACSTSLTLCAELCIPASEAAPVKVEHL